MFGAISYTGTVAKTITVLQNAAGRIWCGFVWICTDLLPAKI